MLALLLFASQDSIIKLLSGSYSVIEILMIRLAIVLTLLLAVALAWQGRIRAIRESAAADLAAGSSSAQDRLLRSARDWNPAGDILDIGEICGWILDHEEGGHRMKD